MVLVPAAAAQRSVDAEMLRLGDRRLGVALVVPHRLHRPDRASRRALPQERRRPLLRVLLGHAAAAPMALETLGLGLCFEALPVGRQFKTIGRTVTEADIVAFVNC